MFKISIELSYSQNDESYHVKKMNQMSLRQLTMSLFIHAMCPLIDAWLPCMDNTSSSILSTFVWPHPLFRERSGFAAHCVRPKLPESKEQASRNFNAASVPLDIIFPMSRQFSHSACRHLRKNDTKKCLYQHSRQN